MTAITQDLGMPKGEGDLSIDVKENTLSIRGEKRTEQEDTTFLHRGISTRSFKRQFTLADHVEVKGARFENGSVYAFAVTEQRLKFFDREKGTRVPPVVAILRQA